MTTIYEKLELLQKSGKPIDVKFIRLGGGGDRFNECLENKSMYFGFGTNEFLEKCNNFNENEEFIKNKLNERGYKKVKDTMRQLQSFFEDDGNTLWVTTANRTIYFGFSDGENAFLKNINGSNETYKNMKLGWTNQDSEGKVLNISGLNGAITKTLAYQSTICGFSEKYAELLVKRILNMPSKEKDEARVACGELIAKLENLIQKFEPKDFELLIELIISRSGLKRIGVAGKQEELIDLEIQHPMTEEVYIVQVKSVAKKGEFIDYIKKFRNYIANNQKCKMIYAFHHGSIINNDEDIFIWDSRKIAELSLNNGLAEWIIDVAPV